MHLSQFFKRVCHKKDEPDKETIKVYFDYLELIL